MSKPDTSATNTR